MRLISWNCNCAFRNKYKLVSAYHPDILICPESESPQQLSRYPLQIPATGHIWVGATASKGLSVFTFNQYKAELAPFYNPEYQFVLPVIISGGKRPFLLLAVWTKGTEKTYSGYIVQACRAVEYYRRWFDEETIIAGDFNSNKIWDDRIRHGFNHSRLVDLLSRESLTSIYHWFSREEQGRETRPTIYMHKSAASPYHIDYIFADPRRSDVIRNFALGTYQDWITFSDHMPLYLETAG